ncbi:hypothetical protein IQ07DRAFT_160947 [Pyrenochaeta sp. DS3sAY3a]|nr:hypothetical protein IQ07DRAFT_160947 [Pyrenochaeta sp. DS3sAY3a]
MATGIEAAGLVLAAIPLILAGLQFYAEGIVVTKRYWKYKEEVNSLLYELRAENTMYINCINILLFGVVSQKDMAEFLKDPGGSRWKEKKFDQDLQRRLGASYDTYMETVQQMIKTADKFKEKLKLDQSGKPQFNQLTSFKEHYKRLKFSLKKSDYAELVTRLRNANHALHRMTAQTAYIENHQLAPKTKREYIPNFRAIKNNASSFHSALTTGWNCPCRANHGVNLRLEARMESLGDDSDSDDDTMKGPFHVLFCYDHFPTSKVSSSNVTTSNVSTSKNTASISTSTVSASTLSNTRPNPWSWEEADVRIELNPPETQPSTTPIPTTQPTKSVQFAQPKMQSAVHAALTPHPNLQPIKDLCSAIRTLQNPQRDVCFSLLAHEIAFQKYGIHIYPCKRLPPASDTSSWSISSLRSVLDDAAFARQDRLKLAVTLASSCLQLHETPWLGASWGKDTIFFVKRPGEVVYDQPFVAHGRLAGAGTTRCMPASMSRIIRNQTLYALGVALIELWYGKALAELRRDGDGPCGVGGEQLDFMTEWNVADRLVDDLYSEAGGKYSDAVRRCIRCDFDRRASSLEDAQFQRAVYQGVVTQLKENYEFLYQGYPS